MSFNNTPFSNQPFSNIPFSTAPFTAIPISNQPFSQHQAPIQEKYQQKQKNQQKPNQYSYNQQQYKPNIQQYKPYIKPQPFNLLPKLNQTTQTQEKTFNINVFSNDKSIMLDKAVSYSEELKTNTVLFNSFIVVPHYINTKSKLEVQKTIRAIKIVPNTQEQKIKYYQLQQLVCVNQRDQIVNLSQDNDTLKYKTVEYTTQKPEEIVDFNTELVIIYAKYELQTIQCPSKKCKGCNKCKKPQYGSCCNNYCDCICPPKKPCHQCNKKDFCYNKAGTFCCDNNNKIFKCEVSGMLHTFSKNKCMQFRCEYCDKCPKFKNGYPCDCDHSCECSCEELKECKDCKISHICMNPIGFKCCEQKNHKCPVTKKYHFFDCMTFGKFWCETCNKCFPNKKYQICKCSHKCKCPPKQIVESQINTIVSDVVENKPVQIKSQQKTIVSQPITKPVEKLAKKPVKKQVDKLIEKPVEKLVILPVIEKSIEKSVEEPVKELVKELVNKPVNEPIGKPAETLSSDEDDEDDEFNECWCLIQPCFRCNPHLIVTNKLPESSETLEQSIDEIKLDSDEEDLIEINKIDSEYDTETEIIKLDSQDDTETEIIKLDSQNNTKTEIKRLDSFKSESIEIISDEEESIEIILDEEEHKIAADCKESGNKLCATCNKCQDNCCICDEIEYVKETQIKAFNDFCDCERPNMCLLPECSFKCQDHCGHLQTIKDRVNQRAIEMNYKVVNMKDDGDCLPNAILYCLSQIDENYKNVDQQFIRDLLEGEKQNKGVFCEISDINKIAEFFEMTINIVFPNMTTEIINGDRNIFIGYYGIHFVSIVKQEPRVIEQEEEKQAIIQEIPVQETTDIVIEDLFNQTYETEIKVIQWEEEQILFYSTYEDLKKLDECLQSKTIQTLACVAGGRTLINSGTQNIQVGKDRMRLAQQTFDQQSYKLLDNQLLIAFSDKSYYIFQNYRTIYNDPFSVIKFTDSQKTQIMERIQKLSEQYPSILIQAHKDEIRIKTNNLDIEDKVIHGMQVKQHRNGGQSSVRFQRLVEQTAQRNCQKFIQNISKILTESEIPKETVFIIDSPQKSQIESITKVITNLKYRCFTKKDIKLFEDDFRKMFTDIDSQEQRKCENEISEIIRHSTQAEFEYYTPSKNGDFDKWFKNLFIQKIHKIVMIDGNKTIKNPKLQEYIFHINLNTSASEIVGDSKFTAGNKKTKYVRKNRIVKFCGMDLKEDQIMFIYDKILIHSDFEDQVEETKSTVIQQEQIKVSTQPMIQPKPIIQQTELKELPKVSTSTTIKQQIKTDTNPIQTVTNPIVNPIIVEEKKQEQPPQRKFQPKVEENIKREQPQRKQLQYFITNEDRENFLMLLTVYKSLGMFKYFQIQLNKLNSGNYTTKDLYRLSKTKIEANYSEWTKILKDCILPQNVRGALCDLYRKENKAILSDLYKFNQQVFTTFNQLKFEAMKSQDVTEQIKQLLNTSLDLDISKNIKLIESVIGNCSNQRCQCTMNKNLTTQKGKLLNSQLGGICLNSRKNLDSSWLELYNGRTQFKMPKNSTQMQQEIDRLTQTLNLENNFIGSVAIQPSLFRGKQTPHGWKYVEEKDKFNKNKLTTSLSNWFKTLEGIQQMPVVDRQPIRKPTQQKKVVQTIRQSVNDNYLQNLQNLINSDGIDINLKFDLLVLYEQKKAVLTNNQNYNY